MDRAGPGGAAIDGVCDSIGETPIAPLRSMPQHWGCKARLRAKLEFFNPTSSVKDRIALSMVRAAEESGELAPGGALIEPTSGNTGVALAFVAAARGYRLTLTMPKSMSNERRKMAGLFGAEVRLTPATAGMRGAIEAAEALRAATPGAVILQQFDNPANPAAHEFGTGSEILRACGGRVDAIVAGVGTGGTLTGVARAFEKAGLSPRMVAVEPENSAVLSGGRAGPHAIQGIGAGFVPKNLDVGLIDEVLSISEETAFRTAREAAASEGLAVGISSGAALAAALELGARREMEGAEIVVVLASGAERYLSTELFEGL